MKLARLNMKATIRERAMHMLTCSLMAVDCIISVITLGFIDTIFAAPLIMKRREFQQKANQQEVEAVVKKIADEIMRKTNVAIGKAGLRPEGMESEEIVDWSDVVGKSSRKDN